MGTDSENRWNQEGSDSRNWWELIPMVEPVLQCSTLRNRMYSPVIKNAALNIVPRAQGILAKNMILAKITVFGDTILPRYATNRTRSRIVLNKTLGTT